MERRDSTRKNQPLETHRSCNEASPRTSESMSGKSAPRSSAATNRTVSANQKGGANPKGRSDQGRCALASRWQVAAVTALLCAACQTGEKDRSTQFPGLLSPTDWAAVQDANAGKLRTMSVRVWPERAILFPGEILRLEAQAVDRRSSGLSDHAGSWSSSDPRVATVDATGMLECHEPGATTIRFTFRDAVAETHIEVRDASLRGLNIIAPASALEAGQSCELVAVAEFENGMVRDVSDQVVWQSSKPRVAEVEPDGTITAWAAGSSRVSASWHGVRASLEIFARSGAHCATDRAVRECGRSSGSPSLRGRGGT